MADKPFRVLLDVTELHLESLKYVWINVPPQELKTIADFKASVISKINLDKVEIQLFVRNGLLLNDETVMILREDDTVKVHYVNDQPGYSYTENVTKSKKSSRKRTLSETLSDVPTYNVHTKKCKKKSKTRTENTVDLNLVEMCSKNKKKQSSLCSENLCNQSKAYEAENYNVVFHNSSEKKKTSVNNKADCDIFWKSGSFYSFNNMEEMDENNKSIESNACLVRNSAKDSLSAAAISSQSENTLEKSLNTSSVLNSAKDSLSAAVMSSQPKNTLEKSLNTSSKIGNSSEGLSINNCPKKKRKRRKKRKELLEPVIVVDNTEISKEFKSFATEADKSIERKHVIYSPNSLIKKGIQLDCDNKKKDVEDLMVDTFLLEESPSNIRLKPSNYPKISTPAQSEFCKIPQWSSSLMQQNDLKSHQTEKLELKEGSHRKDSHTKDAEEQSTSSNIFGSKKMSDLDYANLPPLNSWPDIGAHIAYKILELDEHYNPVISGYREGIVKDINLDNEEVEIEFLTHEIKPARTGKFENLKIDEVPLPEIKTCDIVTWSTLVEPKLIASQYVTTFN